MTCALLASTRIRRANLEGYLEAVRYQKEQERMAADLTREYRGGGVVEG